MFVQQVTASPRPGIHNTTQTQDRQLGDFPGGGRGAAGSALLLVWMFLAVAAKNDRDCLCPRPDLTQTKSIKDPT